MDELVKITKVIALKLKVIGLINIQFAFRKGKVYVLEVNPRASRTVPFVSKTTNVPLAKIAAQLSVGAKLLNLICHPGTQSIMYQLRRRYCLLINFHLSPFFLGPEMKSTGEVMGISNTLGDAFLRAIVGSGNDVPTKGTVFISVSDSDKLNVISIARDIIEMGLK